jgi:hypothetical protein
MMGERYTRIDVDNPGFSSMKESLSKEYRRRYGADPTWGEE